MWKGRKSWSNSWRKCQRKGWENAWENCLRKKEKESKKRWWDATTDDAVYVDAKWICSILSPNQQLSTISDTRDSGEERRR